MSESLGLSIGAANLVAAHIGGVPVTRSSVLTLFEHRPTEVGLPEENPSLAEAGLVLRGFVERVGDPAPLVAADGTKYLGEVLTVEAIEAMARTVGYGTPVTVAVPAYWSQAQSTALREEFFAQTDLTRSGVAPVLVSDATAALATLRAKPGFPADGVVALCDFGASGTSVTLTSAGSQQIGPSVRYADFSGDAIDQLILGHVRASDVANTTRIGAQNRLLGECRRAKEQLSTTTLATGSGEDVRLSRSEFEQLVSAPLDRFLGALEEVLQRNGVRRSNLAAVAIVGGGANIPLITTRLSGRLQVPVHTTPQPATSAAIGAAMLGQQQASAGVPTTASPMVENPTELVGTARVIDGDGAVAWSQDADGGDEPVPYTGRDATGEYTREAKDFDYSDGGRADEGPLPWYKRTALVLSVAGACAAVLVAAVLALTLGHTKTNPINTTPPNQPAPPQTSETTTGPNNSPTETVIPPPPPATQPPATTTTAEPTTTSQATTTEPPATTRERPLPPRFEPPFRR